MSLRRYHTPQTGGAGVQFVSGGTNTRYGQIGAGIYTIQRGGNLQRYRTPDVPQRGSGLAESLLKIAGPSVVQAAKDTLSDLQAGKSLSEIAKLRGTQLAKNLKRKAPRIVMVAGKHKVRKTASQHYKKARRRVKDIFSL